MTLAACPPDAFWIGLVGVIAVIGGVLAGAYAGRISRRP